MGKIMHGGIEYSGGGGSVVVANPSDIASTDLTKIKIDGSTYAIPQGGGGSTVTITPTVSTGTKIADFSIDGTAGELYAPSGGGGGSYTETELYSGNASTAGNITLSDDIGNYDEFVIWCGWSASNVNGLIPIRVSVAMFKTFTYVASPQTSTDHIFCYLYSTQYFRVARGSDDTKIYLFDNHSGAIKRVVGIKY